MTNWREPLARRASDIRASSGRCASFLIVVFLLALSMERMVDQVLALLATGEPVEERTWRDLFTWPGLRSALVDLRTDLAPFLWPGTLTQIASLALCVLSIAWLHTRSIKEALTKLGLPRPRRAELTIPFAASVPGLVFVVLTLGVEPRADSLNLGNLIAPFAVLIPVGLLYRGLLEDAGWPRNRSLVVYLLLVAAFPPLLALVESSGPFEVSFVLQWLVLGAVWALLHVWLFVRWKRRLWVLVVTSFCSGIPSALISLDPSRHPEWFGDHHSVVFLCLSVAPFALVSVWTLWTTRRAKPIPRVA